jgi:septum formation protein
VADFPLILASGSPRRREMLTGLGLSLQVDSADIDENVRTAEVPDLYTRRLAREKVRVVAERHHNEAFVLGADTAVSVHDRIYGKPGTPAEAAVMLRALSGGDHLVTTGYALAVPGGRIVDGHVTTRVTMRELAEDEISWYIATGEPFDKAGGYAIQGLAAHFISAISGSVTNVIGLPLAEVVTLLRTFGIPVALQPASL